jgi:hypothetical protein
MANDAKKGKPSDVKGNKTGKNDEDRDFTSGPKKTEQSTERERDVEEEDDEDSEELTTHPSHADMDEDEETRQAPARHTERQAAKGNPNKKR